MRPRNLWIMEANEHGRRTVMGISGQIWHIYGKASKGWVSPFHVRNFDASGRANELYLRYRSCSRYICLRLRSAEVMILAVTY